MTKCANWRNIVRGRKKQIVKKRKRKREKQEQKEMKDAYVTL